MDKSGEKVDLRNKVVLITGGGGNLGQYVTEKLLKKECKVCLVDIDENCVKEACEKFATIYGQGKITYKKCDVTSEDSFKEAMDFCEEKFGSFDILIQSHAILNEKKYRLVIEINLIGTVIGAMLALERMSKDKGGRGGQIINVASTTAFTASVPMPSYAASKAGVVQHTRCVGHPFHFQTTGVSLMCVAPSFLEIGIKSVKEDRDVYFSKESTAFLWAKRDEFVIVQAENVAEEIIELLEKNETGTVRIITGKGSRNINSQFSIEDM